MNRHSNTALRTLLAVAVLSTAACTEAPTAALPTTDDAVSAAAANRVPRGRHHIDLTAGRGTYNVGTVPVEFSFLALDGPGRMGPLGHFRQTLTLNGLLVDFEGRVTCLSVDDLTGRAWIAGVVTKNRSTNPSFQTPIHQVGRDVWFRVVDYGEGAKATQADRTTFLGFEGGAGILTSAQYCAERPWPANDERTNALTSGNIQVK